MHHPHACKLFALLTFLCLAFAVASPAIAQEMKFPTDTPAFTFELPKGWSCKPDGDGNLDCTPGNDPAYAFSILNLKGLSGKDVKAVLPKLAQEMAKSAKIKDFELGDVDSDENGNGVKFTGIRGDGEVEGTEFMVMVHAFEPQKGKWFAVVTAGAAKDDAYHEKDYDSITASISPIED
jgi:hypothetical protein